MTNDPEITALSKVYESLKGLDGLAIKRIIAWVSDKFDQDRPGTGGVPATKSKPEDIPGPALPDEPVKPIEPIAIKEPLTPVKKRRGRKPKESPEINKKPETPLVSTETTRIEEFYKYNSFEELFLFSTTNTIASKILLAAAYLQEKQGHKELTSYIVTSLLKDIGEEIANPSVAIVGLLNKKPPLLEQVGKSGTGKLYRRKFRVTEAGLQAARGYVKG